MALGRGLDTGVMPRAESLSTRSHGRIQLQVLDFLYRSDEVARIRGKQVDFVAVAEIAGVGASRSRVESIRRATKSLAEQGLVLLSQPGTPQVSPHAGRFASSVDDAAARLTTWADRR